MKTLTLELGFELSAIHPMHEFVAEHDAYGPTRLLQWNPQIPDQNVLLLHIAGPRDPFLSMLASDGDATVIEESDAEGTEGFYLFVRETLDTVEQALIGAFAEQNTIIKPPLIYDTDGTLKLTLVGTSSSLQTVLEDTPEKVNVSVHSVREGAVGIEHFAVSLSPRQQETIEYALSEGYYEVPRETTVESLADDLGCTLSTAAEHLRKAESTIVRQVIGFSPGLAMGD